MDRNYYIAFTILLTAFFIFSNFLYAEGRIALESSRDLRNNIRMDQISHSPEELAKEGYSLWLSGNFNKYGEALSLFKRALEKEPDNPEYLSAAGRLLFETGSYEEAFEDLQYALLLNPQKAWIKAWTHICLGEIYEKRGDYSSALIQYEEALKLNTTINSRQEAYGRKNLLHWKHKSSAHFVFAYPEGGIAERDIDKIISFCEEKYSFLTTFLGVSLKEKVQWYLFPSREQCFEIMKEKAGFARPQVNQIYSVYSREENTPSIRHLALLFSFHLGDTVNLDPFFQWGFSEYLSHKSKGLSFGMAIVDLQEAEEFLPLSMIRKDFYYPPDYVSFAESGSFVEYLINRYGIENFKKVWKREDLSSAIKEIYEKSFKELAEEWEQAVDKKR